MRRRCHSGRGGRRTSLKEIYDVKIDIHMVGVLTVFQRLRTEIAAQGFR
jgi:hypothetical protein